MIVHRRVALGACLLVAAACTSGSDVEDRPPGRIDLRSIDPELEELDLGIEDRNGPAIATAEDRLFVFGGLTLEGRGQVEAQGDGVLYDLREQTTEAVPSWPYPPPYQPSAVAIGAEVIVIGAPCPGLISSSHDEVDCGDTTVEAARFDGEEWSELPSPSDRLDLDGPESIFTRAFGVSDGVVLFASGGSDEVIIGFDLVTEAWREFGTIPLDESSHCFADGDLHRFNPRQDGSVTSERFDARSLEWEALDRFEAGLFLGDPASLSCSSVPVVISVTEDLGWDLAVFDPPSWEPLPVPYERPEFSEAVLRIPGAVLVWPSIGDVQPQLLLDGEDTWQELAVPRLEGNPPRLLAMESAVAVQVHAGGQNPTRYFILRL